MRRAWKVLLAVAVAAVVTVWLATPRLIDRFGPSWLVTASFPVDASDDFVRALDGCIDVPASSRVVTDSENGRLTADFHAFDWQVRRVTGCLRDLPGVEKVTAKELG